MTMTMLPKTGVSYLFVLIHIHKIVDVNVLGTDFGGEDTASSMRKTASQWILKNFQHNFATNYTGISKDFVYQLYHHSFPSNIPLLSAPQFTRLFNEIMYKDIEFNPRAR